MQENIMTDESMNNAGYQVMVTGIHWNKKETVGKYRSKKDFSDKLPEQVMVVLPETIAVKDGTPNFYDIVETWIYNFLMKRYNYFVNRCQIWLPLHGSTTID